LGGAVPTPELPVLHVEDPAAWDAWLVDNAATSPGVRLRIAKKGKGLSSPTWAEAVEVALIHGWIDSQASRLDDASYLQRFTRRRQRSPWSKINRDTAERLIEQGRMRPAGLAEVEAARADGRWDRAYPGSATAEVPTDLRAALDASPTAAAAFEELNRTDRYLILYRIGSVKRADTRARKIDDYVHKLAEGWRPSG
jgi:uncharacterized protein YdeI (YjbR/CyaY-like superfamily)